MIISKIQIEENLLMKTKFKLLFITGTSSTGKTTLMQGLSKFMPEMRFITSVTTRLPRKSDPPEDYEYMPLEDFEIARRNGEFISCDKQSDCYYAVRRSIINEALNGDTLYIRSLTPAVLPIYFRAASEKAIFIHLESPPRSIARQRMKKRGDMSPQAIEQRLVDEQHWNREIMFMKFDGMEIHLIPFGLTINETLNATLKLIYQWWVQITIALSHLARYY